MSSSTLRSTAEACFKLLASLNTQQSVKQLMTSIKLNALLIVLQQRDTPFYSFMTNQCGLSLIAICKQFIPKGSEGKEDKIDISIREVEVIFRILCSSAANAAGSSEQQPHQFDTSVERVCELLHITVTAAVADVALELSRTVKGLTASFHQQNQTASSPSPSKVGSKKRKAEENKNTIDDEISSFSIGHQNNNSPLNSFNTSTTFDVDLVFVQKVANHIEVFGSAATAKKIINVLEQVKKEQNGTSSQQQRMNGDGAGEEDDDFEPDNHDEKEQQKIGKQKKQTTQEQNNNNLSQLGRESINLWTYALDKRHSFGGMTEETRQDLIGAALEVTGRELYPAVASTHVAAELVFRKIVDCI